MAMPGMTLMVVAALGGEGFGIDDGQPTSAADGAALVMLGVVFFVVGMVGVFAWTMRRRAQRPDATLEFLAQLKEEEGKADPDATATTPADTWERPPDWWKRE